MRRENTLKAPAQTPYTGKQTLLLACGALAREVLALIESNGFSHLTLHCLPAKLHLYPEKIADAVASAVRKYKDFYEKIYVLYADCGTGGVLEHTCRELGVEMIPGPHCYAFFAGNDRFSRQSDADITAFYLTDFLVRQFDSFVWKAMGLDKHPQLRDMYFGNYTKLIYQAQMKDPALEEKAKAAAHKLGLAYEYRFTGFGDLETFVKKSAQ